MHSLKGTYVKEEPVETQENNDYYPLKILFPPKKARTLYFKNKEQQQEWKKFLRDTIGYQNLFDYYDIVKDVGRGQFGVVKLAIHKKSKL